MQLSYYLENGDEAKAESKKQWEESQIKICSCG